MTFAVKWCVFVKFIPPFITAITAEQPMTMKPKPKQNLDHPWKKPFRITTAIAQKAVRKELDKRGIK